jgi:hypothetical protein
MSKEVHALHLAPGLLGGSGRHALFQGLRSACGPLGSTPLQELFVRHEEFVGASGTEFSNVIRDGRHGG